MAKARTIILVTFVTLLIWAFAEGQSLQTKRTVAELEFTPVSENKFAMRVAEDQAWRGRVELLVEGSTASLDGLESALRGAIKLSPGMDGVPRTSGEHTIDLRQALRGHPEFRSRGVSVVSAEPATVRVLVDELTTVQVPVRVDVPQSEIDGTADPSVAQVSVRLPVRVVGALGPGVSVIARVRPEDLARFDPGRRVTLRSVRLEAGPDISGVQPLEIIPAQVDVSLTVRSKTETITLPTVPVDVRLPPAELDRWEISIPEEERFLKDVRVTGPSELIRQIRENRLVVGAFVRLSFEDLERGVTSKRAEFADLPGPLVFETEDREIRMTVRRREAEPAGGAGLEQVE